MSVQLIDTASRQHALALRDLTDAARGFHAMQVLVNDVIEALSAQWRCPVVIHRAPAVVAVADNYDRLHYPSEGASRDARYTRYLAEGALLRTQTSAMIPDALRLIAHACYEDVLIACPGLTYRRDSIDRLHTGEPHQLDLWRIKRGILAPLDLQSMIGTVARALLPGRALKQLPASHPYTLNGLEIRVEKQDAWIEIAECGLALPSILAEAGLDCGAHTGLAMGIGLDRVLMLRKGIDDIRLLRSNDSRVIAQMRDLEPYKAVSSQPAIRRDMSIAVAVEMTAEEIGDRVRAALGGDAECIEAVEIVSEETYYALSLAARRRLGIQPQQKNVLLRVVLRHLDRPLRSDEANEVRDRIYAALHQGTAHVWAARDTRL